MRVVPFSCGPAANESELRGFKHLENRLRSEPRDEEWVLLTNLAFSVTHQLQSDEIDIVVIGPTGVQVIEIKHWTAQWVDAHKTNVQNEVDRLTNKARKVGTTLRRVVPQLPRVDGAILLTQEPSKVKRLAGHEVRGVRFHTLHDWKAAIAFDASRVLSGEEVKRLATALQPRSVVAIDGSLRRLAGYVNLELQSAKDERFHRVYKGSHPARRDRVVLHLYDLSASEDKNAEAKARREFEALHHLQLHVWAPRILDSYQDAPGYEGEMFFFTVVDPAAPSIEDRGTDTTWTARSRLAFAPFEP
jgi:Nuclease-related domain